MPEKPNAVTEIALDFAMQSVVDAAAPWTVPKEVIATLRGTMKVDFSLQINTYKSWRVHQPTLARLGKYVGVLAAYLAESKKGYQRKPGNLTLREVETALFMVKVICPNVPNARGSLCGHVPNGYSATPDIREALESWLAAKKH